MNTLSPQEAHLKAEDIRWSGLLEKLSQLAPPGSTALAPKDVDDAVAASVLFEALEDANGVAIAAMHGVQNADTHPEAAFREWALNVNRHRSGWGIAGAIALCECAALERFLSSVGPRWIDARVVARMRGGPRGTELSLDDGEAKARLIKWTKPTGEAGGDKWIARVQEIFGCTIDASVAEALKSMINLRHQIAHGDRPASDQDFRTRSGPEIRAWGKAVQWLACTLLSTR